MRLCVCVCVCVCVYVLLSGPAGPVLINHYSASARPTSDVNVMVNYVFVPKEQEFGQFLFNVDCCNLYAYVVFT